MDVQAKEQAEAVRCLSLEKEARTFEELMHLRGTYVQRLDFSPSSVSFRTICVLVIQSYLSDLINFLNEDVIVII